MLKPRQLFHLQVGARPTDLKLIVMLMRVFMVNVFEKHAFS